MMHVQVISMIEAVPGGIPADITVGLGEILVTGAVSSKAESIEKVSVEQLFKQLESTAFSIDDQPYASLFKIYHQEFLLESVSKEGKPSS